MHITAADLSGEWTSGVQRADVSWLSKHHHEAEVLFNPCVLRITAAHKMCTLPASISASSGVQAIDAMVLRVSPEPGAHLGLLDDAAYDQGAHLGGAHHPITVD